MRRLYVVFVLLSYFCLVTVVAQEAGILPQLLDTPWDRLFLETGALAGLVNLLVTFAKNTKPELVKGPVVYGLALLIGVVAGAIGDVGGLVSANEFSAFPKPLAGMSYGLVAALSAVGLHQGKRQTDEVFRDNASRKLRR